MRLRFSHVVTKMRNRKKYFRRVLLFYYRKDENAVQTRQKVVRSLRRRCIKEGAAATFPPSKRWKRSWKKDGVPVLGYGTGSGKFIELSVWRESSCVQQHATSATIASWKRWFLGKDFPEGPCTIIRYQFKSTATRSISLKRRYVHHGNYLIP